MRLVNFDECVSRMRGKTVAVVGSGPSIMDNEPGFIDSHDVVVRVNNYKVGAPPQGKRCDVHYAFYGTSIMKSSNDLKRDGVTLCMCKCPDDRLTEDDADISWHIRSNKPLGINYAYIYENRRSWWFCDTFIPSKEHFMRKFNLLGRHQPTTGFAAILDVLECQPALVYLTGFDFFTSGLHNVNEEWKHKNTDDPICHTPDAEADWIAENLTNYPIDIDVEMERIVIERSLYPKSTVRNVSVLY